MDRQTVGRTHTAIKVLTCESCNTVKTLKTYHTGMVESIGGYKLEQSVSIRAVPQLIVGEAGAAVEFFGKASTRFLIPVV